MKPDLIHKQSLILYRLRRQPRSDDNAIFWVDARHLANRCLDFGLGFAGNKIVLDLFVPGAMENNCFCCPTEFCESFCHSWEYALRTIRFPGQSYFMWSTRGMPVDASSADGTLAAPAGNNAPAPLPRGARSLFWGCSRTKARCLACRRV
jgi:hypothetical protein